MKGMYFMSRRIDLTGKNFGKLTVIKEVPKPENLTKKQFIGYVNANAVMKNYAIFFIIIRKRSAMLGMWT